MALRFLADHCIPNAIVEALNEANHEVIRFKRYFANRFRRFAGHRESARNYRHFDFVERRLRRHREISGVIAESSRSR